MDMTNKRKRSVSLSLYQPMDSRRQAVLDAISGIKDVSTSATVKHLQSKLECCFAECQQLFRILDANGNSSVSQQEWLKFSLPNSFHSGFQNETKESTFKQLPSRKPSYINMYPSHHSNTAKSKKKYKRTKKCEEESIPIVVGQSIKVISKKSRKIRKRRQRRPSYAVDDDKRQIRYSEEMVMKQMLIDDFKSIDINNNGDIDQFEWWIFYMTNELNIYWAQKEKQYRITTFLNILKIIGPHVDFTTEWLQSKVLSKKVKSKKKYYILWWFFYEHFAGKVENASLLGSKSVSKLEVLSWFIALDFDPFLQQQMKTDPESQTSMGLESVQENIEVPIENQAQRLRSKSVTFVH